MREAVSCQPSAVSSERTAEKRVWLKCESDHPSFDQTPFEIVVSEENEDGWHGWGEFQDRSGVPSFFPKFAWKRVLP